MIYRPLGRTGLQLSWLSFGASSLGAEFRSVDLNEAMRSVRVALDLGMNFIDTSPFYGRGMSECLLGVALRGVPRDSLLSSAPSSAATTAPTSTSRARRVVESVDVSLHRMGVDHLDIMLCHDIEFVEMSQIVEETLPALRKIQEQGKVRFIGVSGYPMNIFRYVLDRTDLDVDPLVQPLHAAEHDAGRPGAVPEGARASGIMNAAPFSARLLTNAAAAALAQGDARGPRDLPHRPPSIARRRASTSPSSPCSSRSPTRTWRPASSARPTPRTSASGSSGPTRRSTRPCWPRCWRSSEPIHNWFYIEGRPENNDPPIRA